MLASSAQRWVEAEIALRGRAAQPSNDMFPSHAALVADERLPPAAIAARDFYREGCFDWGDAWVFGYRVADHALLFVYAGTDGDQGWLEIFDASGALLTTATLVGDHVHWEDTAVARARVASGEFPAP